MTINIQGCSKNRYLTLEKQNTCLRIDLMFHFFFHLDVLVSHTPFLSILVQYFLVQLGILKVSLF